MFEALKKHRQWVAYKLIPLPNGKTKKRLINVHTGDNASTTNPNTWASYDEVAAKYNQIGFVFTESDPYFFVDIDDCIEDNGDWNAISHELYAAFPNAYVEYSQSGRGLHIIGIGRKPDGHRCKSDAGFDIYVAGRFVALCPDKYFSGDVAKYDHTAQLEAITGKYLEPTPDANIAFTDEQPDDYMFNGTDEELIDLALKATSTAARFGGKATFRDIWTRNETELIKHFPNDQDAALPDESAIESALCYHLSWWTGGNAMRIERIVTNYYPHVRDKWIQRGAYREGTVLKAVANTQQSGNYYSKRDERVTEFMAAAPVPTVTPGDVPRWVAGVTPGGHYGKEHTSNSVEFLRTYYDNGRYLRRVSQDYYRFDGRVWRPVDKDTLRAELTQAMLAAEPQDSWISGTMNVIASMVHGSEDMLGEWPGRDTNNVIVYQNGILDLTTDQFEAHTPDYFTTNIMPYDYDPTAQCIRWSQFLWEIFEGDQQRVDLLQEWLGYCLVRDYSFHKILLLIGVKRSGKSTIGRILRKLVGEVNYTGMGLEDLASDENLNGLRNKLVAFDGDAHSVSPKNQGIVLTRAKKISGNDDVNFQRKYLSSLSVRIPTRLTIAANNMLSFIDDSGALTGRLMPLPLNVSFYGREDTDLENKLTAEISGIANWAIAGLKRLRANNRFTEPDISREEIDAIADRYSPLLRFAEDVLVFDSEQRVTTEALFNAYSLWCRTQGQRPGTQASLTANIRNTFRERRLIHTNITPAEGGRKKGFIGIGIRPAALQPVVVEGRK